MNKRTSIEKSSYFFICQTKKNKPHNDNREGVKRKNISKISDGVCFVFSCDNINNMLHKGESQDVSLIEFSKMCFPVSAVIAELFYSYRQLVNNCKLLVKSHKIILQCSKFMLLYT